MVEQDPDSTIFDDDSTATGFVAANPHSAPFRRQRPYWLIAILLSVGAHAVAGWAMIRAGVFDVHGPRPSGTPVPLLTTLSHRSTLLAGTRDGLEQATPPSESAAPSLPEMAAMASTDFQSAQEILPAQVSLQSKSAAVLSHVGTTRRTPIDLTWQKSAPLRQQEMVCPTAPAETVALAQQPGKSHPAHPRGDNRPARYPASELRQKHEGTVILSITVAVDGSVSDVAIHTSSGFPGLDRSAIDDARTWHFEPAWENGCAVTSELLQPVVYRVKRAGI